MPPKKSSNQQTVKDIMDKIAVLNENVHSRRIHAPKRLFPMDSDEPMKKVKFVEPEIPETPAVVSDDPAANSYAQEIFMYKTNVHEVASEIVLKRNGEKGVEKMIRSFKRKLYRMFAREPKSRIRHPLDQVRFESEYYEYRFFLALNRPLHSDEQYQDYRQMLTAAGVAESWVSMRKNNRLLVYEDKIVAKVKSKFKEWSLKLDKLDYYLMDMHGRQPVTGKPTVTAFETSNGANARTEDDDKLLELIMNHSNAKQRLMGHQIRLLFPRIQRNLQKCNGFQWLVFDDDELNKRYKLGNYRSKALMEIVEETKDLQESVASASRPGSNLSESSEIVEMRSEMAMTQPLELPQMNNTRFADTQALINGLEGVEIAVHQQESAEIEVGEIMLDNDRQESMLTPAQTEIVEVSDSSVPPENDEVEIKEEFFYTLDYMKKYTNIDDHIAEEIKQKYPNAYEKKLKKLDTYVERYYNNVLNILLTSKLPSGLRMLTRKERREREASRVESGPQLNASKVSSVISDIPPTNPSQLSPITETPSVPRVIRKSRIIMYEEDEDDLPTEPSTDTMPMPNSEDFLPSIFSTQIPYEQFEPILPPRLNDTPRPVESSSAPSKQNSKNLAPSVSLSQRPQQKSPVRRQDTPINSPSSLPASRQQHPLIPTPSSRMSTPAFETSGLNETVIDNPNVAQSPVIKRELNTTAYEGEVEYVEVIDEPILINDTIDNTSNNIPELLERQPSCMAALPDNLRGMVSSLFQEIRDTTLSQGSGTSGGSGEPPSEKQANTSAPSSTSMGFHQATASTQVK